MKNFLKIAIFIFLPFLIGSCSEVDKDPVVSPNGFLLKEPTGGTSYILLPQNDADIVTTLEWDQSNNGMPSVSSYEIEIAKSGTNFANPINAVKVTDPSPTATYSWTVAYLNSLLNQIGFAPCESVNIDVRIKSILGLRAETQFIQYSNVRTIAVTPYSTNLPLMAFSSDGNITDATPKLASSGILNSDYEGYMWLTPGTYKFYQPDACGSYATPTVYGDNGSGNTLAINGAGHQVLTAGFFLVKANTATTGPDALSYTVRPTTWNVFGTAKNFPLANAAMTYDSATKLWKSTISLTSGYGFKFRSNGVGTNLLVLGKYLATTVGTGDYGGPILSYVPNTTTTATLPSNELPVEGARPNPRTYVSYDVTLDLNSPRNYNYTITLH